MDNRKITSIDLSPFGSQQSIEDEKPSEPGQLFDPQMSLVLLHSSLESQSPSLTSQGSSVVQKSSSLLVA